MKQSLTQRRAEQARKQADPRALKLIKKAPMSPRDVLEEKAKAVDGVNLFIEAHKDIYLRYIQDFQAIAAHCQNPYTKKGAIEDLTLSKYPRIFAECVERYSKLSYWTERAAQMRVDEAFVLARPGDVPGWLEFLQGSENKAHAGYSPVKGKTYLPTARVGRREKV